MKIKMMITLVSIFLMGCVPYGGRPIVYEAEKSGSVFSFYVDGKPVSAIVTANSIFQSTIDYSPGSGGRNYIRMWVSYTNYDKKPVLFNPMESFTLTQIISSDEEFIHIPVYPSKITNSIQNEKQAALIANAFVGIAEAASIAPTTYYQSTGGTIHVNDLQEKLNAVNQNNASRASDIANSYDYSMRNLNSIILRKNTVFSFQSVSGFVYFEIKGTSGQAKYSPEQNKFVLNSNFADIHVAIQFNPVQGY